MLPLAMSAIWSGCNGPSEAPDAPEPPKMRVETASQQVVRFVAVGDTGKGNDTQKAVAAAMTEVCAEKGCDFALLLGDNLYPDGMTSPDDPRMDAVFTDIYEDVPLTFHGVLGNHDYGRQHVVVHGEYQLAWATEHDQLSMPAAWYRFTAGPAELWALDTDTVFWEGHEAQAAWLDATLPHSDAKWKVVFGHHPYRSNGRHGNAGQYEGWSNIPYASGRALRTLFDHHVAPAANLYLCGHEHNLQSLEHDGLELVVSGAGASARPLIDRGNTLRAGHDVAGFAWIELSDALSVAFYDQHGTELSHDRITR